jgi:hypothetical protein
VKVARKPLHTDALIFRAALKQAGLPYPESEYRFWPGRLFRFDWAWLPQQVALEVDGAVWVAGRHTRGAGWLKDTEKLNEAVCRGWRVLRCTPQQLPTPTVMDWLRRTLR